MEMRIYPMIYVPERYLHEDPKLFVRQWIRDRIVSFSDIRFHLERTPGVKSFTIGEGKSGVFILHAPLEYLPPRRHCWIRGIPLRVGSGTEETALNVAYENDLLFCDTIWISDLEDEDTIERVEQKLSQQLISRANLRALNACRDLGIQETLLTWREWALEGKPLLRGPPPKLIDGAPPSFLSRLRYKTGL